MALTNEDLQAIAQLLQPIRSDLSEVQSDIKEIKQRVKRIGVSLKNETNKNIQLYAENHGNLVNKLNQAIKVSDKTTLYEIQVNILKSKVDKLEKDVAEIKNHIA